MVKIVVHFQQNTRTLELYSTIIIRYLGKEITNAKPHNSLNLTVNDASSV